MVRYDANFGWLTPTLLAQEDPDLESCYYCEWHNYWPTIHLAMNARGDAIAAWTGFDAAERLRVVRASRYQSGSGWDGVWNLIRGFYLMPGHERVAMDWHGNGFVTSLHDVHGTQVTRYDVNTGWQSPLFVVENWPPVGYNVFGTW